MMRNFDGTARLGQLGLLSSPRLASDLHQLPAARRETIFRLRREIAEGGYADDHKLERALDRMFDRLIDEAGGDHSPLA